MIRVDETDPVGEVEPSFPYRNVTVRHGVQFKDHYDVQSEIGRGKFGTVYRCTDKSNGLMLAAKVVSIIKKEDKRSVEREVEIMRRLQHPRLIQLYDAIDAGRQFYVVLELIQGGELFERVIDDDFILTERSCAVFMRQICEGVEFIHGQKILHLDLKPENILCLTKEGNRIKIIDFGLARIYDPKKKLQVLFGTPEFVAPEVVNFDQIGFGTDMWSIGVICYVLLSGLSPFMGDTDIETMANVTIARYDFDHDAFAEISEDAKDFIRCLLLQDKDKRMMAAQCQEHPWLTYKVKAQQEKLASNQITPEKAQADSQYERKINSEEELDQTKDNLRLFVERWREHPNSPYVLEGTQWLIPRSQKIKDVEDIISLRVHSPSPRASISSSSSETTASSATERQDFLIAAPKFSLGFERRASEGTAVRKSTPDPASQIKLAEEIVKLSEHLRLIALETNACSYGEGKKELLERDTSSIAPEKLIYTKVHKSSDVGTVSKDGSHPTSGNKIPDKFYNKTRNWKFNEVTSQSNSRFEKCTEVKSRYNDTFALPPKPNSIANKICVTDTDGTEINTYEQIPDSPIFKSFEEVSENSRRSIDDDRLIKDSNKDLSPPWRRPRVKHFFGETSRDVPRRAEFYNVHKDLCLDEPANTKDLILQLLREWDETATRSSRLGRKSVSVDWCAEESVGRKTINSLAEYFQLKRNQSTPTVEQAK